MFNNVEILKEKITSAITIYNSNVAEDKIQMSDSAKSSFAEKTITAKEDLKNMLRKHPNWNEDEECIVQEIEVITTLNFDKIDGLLLEFLYYHDRVSWSEHFLLSNYLCEDNPENLYEFIKYAGKAYKSDRKKSRVLRKLAKLKGWDKFEGFDKWFAEISNELNISKTKKVNLIVSVNPTHFLTMSNPHHDSRGEMLTSCHSLNADYQFKNGCVGYARDAITMIAFTVDDISKKESWLNRKTSRQLFMYEPKSGVLLQSRMYNANGGTTGQRAESADYRKAVQTIIATCENTPNEWDCEEYIDNSKEIIFKADKHFGGYTDWTHKNFHAMLSTQKGFSKTNFTIGKIGICFDCGEDTSWAFVCENCSDEIHVCELCGNQMDDDNSFVADYHGETIIICEHCLEDGFEVCVDCNKYVHHDDAINIEGSNTYICPECLEYSDYYAKCADCGKVFRKYDLTIIQNEDGSVKYVCDDNCLSKYHGNSSTCEHKGMSCICSHDCERCKAKDN